MNTTANAMWKISRLAVAIAFYALAMASTTFATFYVSPTGDDGNAGTQASPFKTIQKALSSITKDNCWNNKIMIEAGTYKIESELTLTASTYTYTIQSVSGDPSDVTIDAQGLSRCFNCNALEISFKGITFINGSASGDGGGVLSPYIGTFENCVFRNCKATGRGGAICVSGHSKGLRHLNNVLIEGCSAASDGGGIYVYGYDGAAFTAAEGMSNCRIYNCSSDARGGGVYIKGTTHSMESNCDISSNTVSEEKGGGGIYAVNATIRFCTVTNNVCDHSNTSSPDSTGGSGIRLETTGTIDGCLVKGNSFTYDCSSYNGGGSAVWLASGASLVNSAIVENSGARSVGMQWNGAGGILVSNCLFKSNVARRTDHNGRGGILSLYALNADSLIIDCRFIDNQAAAFGGFVEMDLNSGSKDSTLRIRNCLISGNSQSAGNGLVWANSGTSATANRLVLENCTIVSNTVAQAPVIRPYTESSSYTSGNFVNVRGCAILFNGGKAAFNNSYEASANVTYNCTEMSGMSAGNITYDSTKPLFEDIANGNYRPAAGSQLRDIVPSAAWMGDGRKNSPSRDLGTGYEVQPAEAYGVNVVWTDTLPRLSGSAADIGAFERWIQPGLNIIFR